MYDVTVYSQPGCTHCRVVIRKLDKLGVEYTVTDITADDEAAAHLRDKGWRSTPVVEVSQDGLVIAAWDGVRPDALNALGAQSADLGAFDKQGA